MYEGRQPENLWKSPKAEITLEQASKTVFINKVLTIKFHYLQFIFLINSENQMKNNCKLLFKRIDFVGLTSNIEVHCTGFDNMLYIF